MIDYLVEFTLARECSRNWNLSVIELLAIKLEECMGYPKQAGQDAQAHRDLAARHLVVVQEREALRGQLAAAVAEREALRTKYEALLQMRARATTRSIP